MNGKINQVTVFALKPGFEDVLAPELALIVGASRQITGCHAFDLYPLSEEQPTWDGQIGSEDFAREWSGYR